MTWLTPWLAGIAAAIAIPTLLILYFLKLRRRDVEISTTLLWKKAIQDMQANAPFQRLRRNLLLFLQLLVLGGILAALGQPQIKGQTITGRKHVVMIDRSASMLSLDEKDGRGQPMDRLAQARAQAIAFVESLREAGFMASEEGDEAMVIAFDTVAEVRQQFTSDKAALRRAIESITAVEGPTRIEEAMRLAKAHKPRRILEDRTTGQAVAVEGLYSGEPVTLHIFSDGRLPDAGISKPAPDDRVEFQRVGGTASGNTAITGIRSERNYEDPSKLSVFVAISNADPQARTLDVELSIDGSVAGIKSATIPGSSVEGVELSGSAAARAARDERATVEAAGVRPAGTAADGETAQARAKPGTGGVVFQLDRGSGATVRVRLRSPASGEALEGDVLALDDSAWLIVPPARRLAVAVVSPQGNLFLSSVLSGLPLSRLVELTPDQFEERAAEGKLSEFDVVILDGWLPTMAAAAPVATAIPAVPVTPGTEAPAPAGPVTNLPPGRFLVLGGVPALLAGRPSGMIDEGKGTQGGVVDWRRDHPTLRGAALDNLIVAEMRKVRIEQGGGSVAIATGDQGPAIIEASNAEVKAIVVPFDPAASTWPFDVSFVVFTASAVGYLGDDGATGTGRMVQPGQVLADRVPAGATDIKMRTPDGVEQAVASSADGSIAFGPLVRTGVYELTWNGPGGPTDEPGEGGEGGRMRRVFAANLADPEESDVAAVDTIELANQPVAASGDGSAVADLKLWPWLILFALAFVMFEWFIYNRKVYV